MSLYPQPMVDGQQSMILSESTKSAQLGQRACPCWVTCLPHLGTLLAPLGQKMHQTAAQLVNVVISTFLFSGFCQHMQFLPSDTSSHLQTIQTIENNHQVANHLYIKALQQKPDNLTILFVFLVTNLYQAIMETLTYQRLPSIQTFSMRTIVRRDG